MEGDPVYHSVGQGVFHRLPFIAGDLQEFAEFVPDEEPTLGVLGGGHEGFEAGLAEATALFDNEGGLAEERGI